MAYRTAIVTLFKPLATGSKVLKYRNITNVSSLLKFLEEKHDWKFLNLYWKSNGEYIRRYDSRRFKQLKEKQKQRGLPTTMKR